MNKSAGKIFLSVFIFLLTSNLFAGTVYKNGVVASYYAEQFHGKKTSNGERFNMYDYTCAHKSLPFNTIIKVTNLANGKVVNVRVNDRGPFVIGREIDLSKAAAVSLGMIGSGTTKVRLEIEKMGPSTKKSIQTANKASKMMEKLEQKSGHSVTTKKTTSTVQRKPGQKWDIQVGAFSSRDNAEKKAQDLIKAGFDEVALQTQKSTNIIRVVIRNVDTSKLNSIESKLKQKGFSEYTIRERTLK